MVSKERRDGGQRRDGAIKIHMEEEEEGEVAVEVEIKPGVERNTEPDAA